MPKAGPKAQMIALSKLDWRLFLCLLLIGCIGTWVPLFDLDEGAALAGDALLVDAHHHGVCVLRPHVIADRQRHRGARRRLSGNLLSRSATDARGLCAGR